ncbi:Ig-like domain-containing protein [Vibrio sp. TRT 17S01]|uniref:Ig-like domain-containing protein n=1 Tax=Vibrio sp. TRT 17S01 TaxID=3418505 RepID=UPI003CF86CD8
MYNKNIVLFFVLFLMMSTFDVYAANKPKLESISGGNDSGMYNEGDQIDIYADFSSFISPSDDATSPSKVTLKLDTGPDAHKTTINLTSSASLLLDESFGVPNTPNLNGVNDNIGVWDILELSNGDILIGGYFTSYEGQATNHLVLVNPDGTVKRTFGGSFSTKSPAFNGEVTSLTETSEGKIIVAGEFYNYNGNGNYDYLVQFNSDFSIDTTFMDKITKNGSRPAFNAAIGEKNYAVYSPNSPVLEHDSKLYVTGNFTQVSGENHNKIVSLNLDGTINTGFTSPVLTFSNAQAVKTVRVDDNETATTADDKLYITGYSPYVVYKGSNTVRPMWRLNMDGTVDETFLSAVTSAFIADVLVLPKSAQEGIVVSGINMSIPGVSGSDVYALKKDGTHNKDGWKTTSINAGYAAEAFAIVEGKLFVGAHNRWPAAHGGGGLVVFNMEDGTVNQPFMKTLGSGKFVGGGTDVHALTLMKDGSLMVGGTFAGYNSQTNDERGVIRMRFNRLKGTYTVREEAKDLTGLMTVDSIESYQVDSIFGGAKDTTAPDLSTLPSGTLEKNTRYSLNRYPTDPVKTKLTVDKSKTPTTGQIVATVTSITEDDKYVGKSGDEVTFSVDNNLVSVTSVTDNKDGTYSVTLSTSETLETKTKISATVNGEAIQNNTSSPYQLEVTFEDVTKPTIQLSAGKTTLKKGESTTLTMVLSESSTNFALADLSAVGGVISGFSGSDKNYSAIFTATDNFSGNGSVAIKADSFTDAAGNNNANQPSVAFTIDALSPTIAITAGKTALKAGEKTTVTFTLSEAATDFVQKDDITVTGGTLGTLSADAANKVYTAEFTPKVNSTTDAVISVAVDSFNDPAGNPNIVGASLTLSIDTVVPTVAISAGKTALKAGEKTTVTFTLSEAATDFTLNDDITVTGGSLGTLSADTAKKVYTAEFTPKAGSTADAVITVASDSFTDAAGNPNAAGASLTLTIDTVVPTVAITADKTALKAGEKTTVTFTLSEAATDFVQKDDITVTGGTLGTLSADTAKKVYTAEFTPTANSTKDAVITVASDSFSDAAGNLNAAGASLTLTIDTVVPTIAITADASSLKGGETAEVTFTLSEASTDFTSTDITVTGGTLGTLTGSGTTYTAEFTPKTNSDADGVISVAASKFTDAAGNPNATGASLTLTIDTVVPTIEITSDKSALKRGEKATITFTLSKSASDFIASDITVTGGSLGTLTGTGTTYTAEFTPKVDSVANGVITVAANTFTDASGNQNATGHTLTISVDTVAPTIAITSDKSALKAGESAQITFTLSEAADDFKAEDVTTTGGTLGAVTGSGTSYSATFTPTASSTKNGVITVAAGTFTDAAGNLNIKGDTLTLTVDSVVPTIAITSDKSALKAGETAQITFTLSESATDFVANDITVSGGTLGALTGSGTSYSAEFTPSDDSTTAGVISVIANKFSDAAGNANSTGDSLTLTVDTVVPTISITSDKSTLKNGETATITFTLSESSTDFVANDITVTGGALSGFTGTGKSYTATFTPKANSTDDGVVSVVGSKFSDAAGNLNTAGASVTLTIDSVLPGITITSDSLSLKNSETAEITFTLTKSASDFKAEDIEVEGGTLGTLTGSGKSYTATFTPTASSTKDGVISVGTSKFTDSAGNANAVGASLTLSIDTLPPTISVSADKSSVKNGETAQITFTLSEASADFEANDISVTGGTLSTLSGSGKSYSITFTPAADSTTDGVISVGTNKFSDAAGNLNTSGASITLTVDSVLPTIDISSDKTALKAGEKAQITFTLSEAATDFASGDITVTGGSLGTLTGSGTNYSAEFTPTANSTTDGVISVAKSKFSDAAGNLNGAGDSLTLSIDSVVPTIAITADVSALKGGETAQVTFTLSEASTDFESADITVSGGTLGTLTGSGTTYSAEFTPTTNSNKSGVITVAASKFTDAAGNANVAGASLTLAVDTVAPTISITSNKTQLKANETADITFKLSEASQDFVANDVTVSGGTLTDFDGSGDAYTAVFTPTSGSIANGVITVAASKFSDAAGNTNGAETKLTLTIDTVKPTIAITADKSKLKKGDTSTITIVLSEAATDFTVDDLVITVGSITSFTGSGKNYEAVVVPKDEFAGSVSLSVAEGKFTDAAGNNNVVSNTVTFDVNTKKPTTPTVDKSTTNINTPVLTGTSDAGNQVFVTINNVQFVTTATATTAGKWTVDTANGTDSSGSPVDFSALEDNRYDVELYAVDSFGNVSDEDATLDEVTIDTHRPNPPIFYPVTVQQVIKGLGEPQTKVSVKLANGAAVCAQQTIDEFGFWQCNPTVMLSDSQVVEATVTDSAGNTSLVAGTQVVSGAYSMTTTPAMLFNTLGKEISGTGAFAADITVYDDANTTLCKTTVNPLGTWQCVLSANLAPNSKVNVLQFADQVAMNVFTHVIDPDNEWVPPTMYDVRSSLFEGESDYENGSVTIVNGEKICESTISKGYNNSELVNHFSCNASQSVDSTKLAFSFYSMAQKLQSSGLSTPVVVGGTIRDSDFDGRTDLEEWDCNNTGIPCIDTDGDGIPNYLDQDDDGDGIPSVLEQGSNYINTDSDNDGIPDSVESAGITPAPEMKGVDQDRDGIDDALDVDFTGGVDANGDGIDDRYQPRDTDGDGTPDYVDLDSDGDLIPDEVEGTADFDLDGLANYIDTDSDNDGISDQIEAQGNSFTSTTSRSFLAFANFITTPVNSDNDALPDYTDLDSDNDGIPDVIESGGKDEDNNAIADFDSPVITQPLDTDGDGEYDYLDLDSNDDGIFDIYESKGMTEEVVDQELDLNRDGMIDDTHVDSDSDGLPDIVDGFPTGYGSAPIDRANTDDFDNDGIPDSFDLDMDNDGIPNDIEGNMDTDGDGLIDAMDLDSDNDGIPDLLEHFPSFDTAKAGYIVDMIDLNGDGMDDRLVGKPLMDSDNDGVIDSQEIDSDNDGIPDLFEAVGINEVTLITNINRLLNGQLDEKADSDNDGIVDSIDRDGFGLGSNNYFAHALILADTDSDGLRDFQDKDSDNDGYSDKDEYLTDPNLGNNLPYEVTSMETAVSGHGAGGGGSLNLLTGLFVLMTLIVRSVSSMKNKVYILLGAGLALLTPMVHATTCGYLYEDGEFEGCWKLESGIGISRLAPEGESQGWYNESASYKPSWQVAVGYQLSPRWFAEARYAGLGDAKLVNKYSQSGVAAFEGEESISYYVPSIAVGSYFYPYTTDRKWNVYGKIGASSMFNSTSDDRITFEQKNKVQVNFGGGVEYRPTNSAWFFKLEGISYDSDALNTSLLIGRYFGGDKEQPKSKVEQQLDTIEERIIDLETKVDVIPTTEEKTIVVENFNSNSVVDFFKSDSSVLGENGKRELQTLAEKVLSKSDYHVKIYGHTDATGSDEYNQHLSQRRADSAKAYLTSLGLNPDLVEAIGLGESSPIASNDNQQGRSLNRRVNIESSWVE